MTCAAFYDAVARPFVTYGFAEGTDIRAVNVARAGLQSRFQALRAGLPPLDLTINLPGRHNVLNSLAAVAVATELGDRRCGHPEGAGEFSGHRPAAAAARRDSLGGRRALVVDDYGHHPTEVAATLDAVRQGWPERRLVLAFQPHRYTRTRDLLDDFGRALSASDVLLVTEVYAAGEAPITRRGRPRHLPRGAHARRHRARVRRARR